MFLTPDQIKIFLDAHERILEIAQQWINTQKLCRRGASSVRWNGNVFEFEHNDACHCHPEYIWYQLTESQNAELLQHLAERQLIDDPYNENDDNCDKVLVMSHKPK